jgi:hypothetical protein
VRRAVDERHHRRCHLAGVAVEYCELVDESNWYAAYVMYVKG